MSDKEVHDLVAVLITTDAPDLSTPNSAYRMDLSRPHMAAAARFSRAVGQLEHQHKGEPFGAFWDEILHFSTACILTCVASLEAYANELFFIRETAFPGYHSELLDNLWETFEKKPLLEKFAFALTLRRKAPFDRGKRPIQDVAALIELRNHLIHYKSEWENEADRHKRLSRRLAGRFDPSPFFEHRLIFPMAWATHSCTKWAVESCLGFATQFEALAELPPKYSQPEGSDQLTP